MLRSAGYSDRVARSFIRRARERRRMGIDQLSDHMILHPEDTGHERNVVAILAEAAKKTDPELRKAVTERLLSS